jgi:hypothetical protein
MLNVVPRKPRPRYSPKPERLYPNRGASHLNHLKLMNVLRIAAVAILGGAVSHATTLVAVWSPEHLLIGADSRVTTMTNLGLPVQGSACKIAQQGASYFAFAGLVEDLTTQYRADALAHQAFAAGGTLEQRLHQFAQSVREPLVRSLAQLKKDSPDQYASLLQGRPALQAIFGLVEQGPPSLGIVGFNLAPDGSLVQQTQVIAQGDDGRGPRIITAGQQGQIRQYLRDHRDWSQGPHIDLVRTLIELEIAHSTGQVGGPVDMIQLKPNAAEWLQRKAQCAPVMARTD